ncbi:DUF1491 family protein [Sphingomicrobium astaxanthinifaciens]|uniref:DUF1491 family protein n=1 Tax=Sphingomicrobium astaxanthinifaciens TaxID=1227949 RepID=UPI001FCBD9D1|nr:DUF1491 family protein [Sphingomicrobium astaxanthinifaciens]MCJ7421165.1 DUF1491 family protein [Sphingomicrobium astaxanthinifaciens]
MSDRLPAGLEARALMRAAEAAGGMAMVLHRGDAERGSLLLLLLERGRPRFCLGRELSRSGTYEWADIGPTDLGDPLDLQAFIAKRRGFDPDLWVLELDLPDAERFRHDAISLS